MTELPNLDHLDDLQRGDVPEQQPEERPHDTETKARCLIELARIPGITTADRLPPRSLGSSGKLGKLRASGTVGYFDFHHL